MHRPGVVTGTRQYVHARKYRRRQQNNAEALQPGSFSGKAAIVSPAHPVSGHGAELSGFDFDTTIASNARNRWAVHGPTSADARNMTIASVLVLPHFLMLTNGGNLYKITAYSVVR